MWTYLLQTLVFQMVFFALYELLLRKETFFKLNRWYLLLSIPVSLVLPFITVSSLKTVRFFEASLQLKELELDTKLGVVNSGFKDILISFFTNNNLWLGISLIVGGLILSLFLVKLYQLNQLIKQNKSEEQECFTVIELRKSTNAFSFLNYIFLGNLIPSEDKEMILAHEKAHVLDKHSYDLIAFELLKVVLWFNPMLYLFQKRLKEVHEYIADSKSATTTKKAYANVLINQLFQTKHLSFINTFYKKSLTQKRLIMLSKSKSKQSKIAKYLVLIPVLLIMITYNSCSQTQEKIEGEDFINYETNKITNDFEAESLPIKLVDTAPIFPDCTSKDTKDCFSQSISKLVALNFNTNLAEELGLKGMYKIIISFKVDKTGAVVETIARAKHPKLEEEAVRVINLIPKLKPAQYNGKNVTVNYSLPIKFKVN